MQENTESKKPNEAKTPQNEVDLSDEKPTSKPSESSGPEPSFEEQEREVLPPEKKKKQPIQVISFCTFAFDRWKQLPFLYRSNSTTNQGMDCTASKTPRTAAG